MANPRVTVDFVADTSQLQDGMRRASGAAGGFGSKLKGMALGAAAAGFAALGASLKIGVQEFSDAQKVGAQTGAVLKSTGGVAQVSAKQVETLAGALMKKSGVDDEAIQSGENLLLTFTNIRNEAGKGNDIFNQATKAALDMSVAMGTDMKQSAIQVGKALNDPIKGVSKLTRVGVTFTDAQKKQIEQMQKSGDVAGAQKVILAELSKEFGGSAEAAGKTLPGQLSILRESFNNLAGEVVGKMIPPLTALFKLMMDHKTTVMVLGGAIVTLTAGVLAVSAATAVYNAVITVIPALTKAWAAAQWLVNAALSANPIGLVVVAIAALVAAFIVAYKTSDTFRAVVNNAWNAVWGVMKTVFGWVKSNWPLLLGILTGPIGAAVIAIAKNWDTIKSTATSAVNAVKSAVTSAWNAIKSVTNAAWDAVSDAVRDAMSAVKNTLNGAVTWIRNFASGAWTSAIKVVANVWDFISDGASDAVSSVKRHLGGMLDWMRGIIDNVRGVATSIGNAIKAPINAVINAWNRLEFKIPRVTIPKLKIGKKTFGGGGFGGATIGFPNIPQLAKGGIVDQPTLALVGEAGPEAVIPLDRMPAPSVEVRVYIGDRELTDLVRTEIVDSNTGIARTLLAGAAG